MGALTCGRDRAAREHERQTGRRRVQLCNGPRWRQHTTMSRARSVHGRGARPHHRHLQNEGDLCSTQICSARKVAVGSGTRDGGCARRFRPRGTRYECQQFADTQQECLPATPDAPGKRARAPAPQQPCAASPPAEAGSSPTQAGSGSPSFWLFEFSNPSVGTFWGAMDGVRQVSVDSVKVAGSTSPES